MIKIMQISDFHYVDSISQKMLMSSAVDSIRTIEPNLLVITGDLHNYGTDFEPFKRYLHKMVEEGGLKGTDVIIVPGNHDVDSALSDEKRLRRRANIGYVLNEVEKNPDCYRDYRDELDSCFSGYKEVVSETLGGACGVDTVNHHIWNGELNIVTLNTALVSDGRDHQQIIDGDALADLNPCNGLPTIVVGHHDVSCLFDSHQDVLKPLMASWKVSLYMCGDRHKNKQGLIDDVMCNNVKIPVIVAGKGSVESGDDYSDVSFLVYEVDDSDNNIQLQLYKWDASRKRFRPGSFENGEPTWNCELRYSPKRKAKAKRSVQTPRTRSAGSASDKWDPPVVQGYVLIGTQGREGIKYVWRSGDAVFESIALNQKQAGDLRGNRDSTISTYAASVSGGCILQAMGRACSFCASGGAKFGGELTYQDIALQNIFMSMYDDDCECHEYLKENKREFSYTAQGEPGYSYAQVRKAIRLTEEVLLEGRKEDFISKHVIYTCGMVEFLDLLAVDINNGFFKRPVSLHYSLNAVGAARKEIMPVEGLYPYKRVLRACKDFYEETDGATGKIAVNLTAFNKYEHRGLVYTVDDAHVKKILDEIGDPGVFRISVYDYYSNESTYSNKGNEQIERLYKTIKEADYDVKVCHCWGDRVKSAFGMLDGSTEGLSDLGLNGKKNYQNAVKAIAKRL